MLPRNGANYAQSSGSHRRQRLPSPASPPPAPGLSLTAGSLHLSHAALSLTQGVQTRSSRAEGPRTRRGRAKAGERRGPVGDQSRRVLRGLLPSPSVGRQRRGRPPGELAGTGSSGWSARCCQQARVSSLLQARTCAGAWIMSDNKPMKYLPMSSEKRPVEEPRLQGDMSAAGERNRGHLAGRRHG